MSRTHSTEYDAERFILNCRGRSLDCRPYSGQGAQVMGILNVTPDSFSDGGQFLERDDALRRTEQMLEEGAAIIDVGGESSRPAGSVYGEGAVKVEADEEKRRILPVIEAIDGRFPEAVISVDTYKSEVARDALAAGAAIINDITGLRYDPGLADVVAAHDVPLIVMHSIGEPGQLAHADDFDDVVEGVRDSLTESIHTAENAGVEQIVTDPGFGFGKTTADNLRLAAAPHKLLELNRPVMIGISRKSTIGSVLGTDGEPAPVHERLFGTLGATAAAVMRGVSIVRTHDVRATVEMLRVLGATAASYQEEGNLL